MSYVRKTLGPDEVILGVGKFHLFYKMFFFLPPVLIRILTTEIVVTNRRLIHKRGWIRRLSDEININRLEEINIKQGVIGRIFGFGKLRCRGTGVGLIDLPLMSKPLQFRKAVLEAQREGGSTAVYR